EALRLLARASELDRGRADISWQTAQVLTSAGKWEAAIPELQHVIQADPDMPEAYFLLARAYRSLNRIEESRGVEATFHRKEQYARQTESLKAQIGANPESAVLRFKLAEVHVAAGHPELAITLYRHGLQRDP